MVKIKQIGNKEELMQIKKENIEKQKYSTTLPDMTESELSAWIKKHFSTLPNEAKEGLEQLTRAIWSSRRRKSSRHVDSIGGTQSVY